MALTDAVGLNSFIPTLRASLAASDPDIFGTWNSDQVRRYLLTYMAAAEYGGGGVKLNAQPGQPSFTAFVSALMNGLGAPQKTAERFLAAIMRLNAAGAMPFEVYAPGQIAVRQEKEKADAASNPGILDRLKSAGDTAGAFVQYAPWILGGVGVLVVGFVVFPYLQAARGPGVAARRATGR